MEGWRGEGFGGLEGWRDVASNDKTEINQST